MKKVVGMLAVCILVWVAGSVMAQAPEGFYRYRIERGDCLTEIAIRLPGVNAENVLWVAKRIAEVNGIENPNRILAWNYIYIPKSADVLRSAIASGLVITPEKELGSQEEVEIVPQRRALPAEDVITMFIQLWHSRTAAVKELGVHIDKLTETVNKLVKSEELKKKLEEAENILNEQARTLKEEIGELRRIEQQNKWLLLLALIGWALAVALLISLVVVGKFLKTERERSEDLKVENEILKREKNQIKKEKEELKSFIPGNEVKVKAEKDGKKVETYCRIIGTEEKEGKVRRRLSCPYCNIEVWEENMPGHWKKSCKKGPFPQGVR
ncbi:MAG: hypothetical protein DRH33_08480 [Candidatus Nealsonbacteria bacterium]|nr:MAG: hypothetical protein DRH33_08480 [Candidatus Nealsonbacteria bacterium]